MKSHTTFHPKSLLVSAAFAAMLMLAVTARTEHVNTRLAIAAAVALVAIEVLVWMGPALFTRADDKR